MTNHITREKCLEVCGYAPEDKAPFVMSEEELVIFVRASVCLGLEMAADMADSYYYGPCGEYDYGYDEARAKADDRAETIAYEIRKLAEEVAK